MYVLFHCVCMRDKFIIDQCVVDKKEYNDYTKTSTYPECRDTRDRDNECQLYLHNHFSSMQWYNISDNALFVTINFIRNVR